MAKSMRSKIKKKWRAVKRDKLEVFERKKLEEFNRKLLEIAQTPLKSEVKMESEGPAADPLQSMRIEKPKAKKAVITIEMDDTPVAPRRGRSAATN